MQFDTGDLGSSNVAALVRVSGTLLVDDADGKTIARYPFTM